MKYLLSICALVLLTISVTSAQVASHAPTQFSAPQKKTSQPTGKPVARVNGTVLTDRDLQREMFAMFPYAQQHNGNIPPELAPGIRTGALKMIVFEELVYQEALRRKMTVSPERLNSAEVDFRKQFATPQEYQQFLNTEFQGSQQLLREKIKRSLLIDQLLKAEVDKKSTVSPAELKAYYDQNRRDSIIRKPSPSRRLPSCLRPTRLQLSCRKAANGPMTRCARPKRPRTMKTSAC
jgi:peptidyl-prolyl cis-trans isomerase SurA